MGNINDFIILVVIRQRVQERALFLCENLNNIYGEFPTSVDMKEPFVIKDFTQRPEILLLKRVNDIKYVLFQNRLCLTVMSEVQVVKNYGPIWDKYLCGNLL